VDEAGIAMALERLLPRPAAAPEPAAGGIVGRSPAIARLREQIARVAPTRTNVLITGKTGTGKELVAQAIHELSPRRSKPFVAVNCGAIPDGLVESELFGHERGAFTGAIQAQPGRIRQSSGGTLFPDEISELDLRGQVKLLRTLETREVQSLGSERARPLDLRVVAASNRNLTERVRDGAFREDLLYRLNVVQLEAPPLRERSEDIPLLVAAFCERFRREFQRSAAAFAVADLALLQRYDWPGNVRELRNVVEASFVQASMRRDGLLELPPSIVAVLEGHSPHDERQRLIEALFLTRWNVSEAAQRLNCSRMTLYRKLTRYQLRRPEVLEQASA
jgi:two-component system response regulator HydG